MAVGLDTVLLYGFLISLGLLYSNMLEWVLHNKLHDWGKNKKSIWAFHWRDHHKRPRQHQMVDTHATRREVAGLALLAGIHLPLWWISPVFFSTLLYGLSNYYVTHKLCHKNKEWAEWSKTHCPWHYDHHMGPDQNANWCVTKPWFDHIMGTRKYYYGTPLYHKHQKLKDRYIRKKQGIKNHT